MTSNKESGLELYIRCVLFLFGTLLILFFELLSLSLSLSLSVCLSLSLFPSFHDRREWLDFSLHSINALSLFSQKKSQTDCHPKQCVCLNPQNRNGRVTKSC